MFRASSCPSSGAYKLQQLPLVYRWNVVVAVSLVVVGPDRPRPMTLLPPRSKGKREAAAAVYKLLMMGMRMPETCLAVFKRRAINLRDWCIRLVDLFECMTMHGLINPNNDNLSKSSAGVKTRDLHHFNHITVQKLFFTFQHNMQLWIRMWNLLPLFPKTEIILKDNIHEANHKYCEHHDVPSLHSADSLYALWSLVH